MIAVRYLSNTDEDHNMPTAVRNHYLDEFNQLAPRSRMDFLRQFQARNDLVSKYAWAIPSEEALSAIVAFSPLIEIGAGTGYWASLLHMLGADVLCFDTSPPETTSNHWHKGATHWHPVNVGGPEVISKYPERTLFLCWPPYDDDMAIDCLRAYVGDAVVYIGEGAGGCTGNDAFHDTLSRGFQEEVTVDIPQYHGIHDCLTIYRRI